MGLLVLTKRAGDYDDGNDKWTILRNVHVAMSPIVS